MHCSGSPSLPISLPLESTKIEFSGHGDDLPILGAADRSPLRVFPSWESLYCEVADSAFER